MLQQDKLRISLFSAYAVSFAAIERIIPTPIPWLKFGFANIITVIVLIHLGAKAAVLVTLIRVIAGSFIFGTFPGPAFILSLSGGILSVLAMSALYKLTPRLFSAFGISLTGAVFHNLAQILAAYFLFIRNFKAIAVLSPFILLLGTLTGAVNGVICIFILNSLKKNDNKGQNIK
ncbi:Heptaprenyl diphosphate synthase component I [Candidatus Magnetoovum chiemensis]|nr:Heptaprenyl diphosphate synthase component I [Candidatus Magnetoovum chiemensis]